jgi:hypothetical protein
MARVAGWVATGEKRCPACGLTLPVAGFYFYRERPESRCKDCANKRRSARKQASMAGQEAVWPKQPRSDEYRIKHAERAREWYRANKARHAAWKSERRRNSPAIQVKERITKAIAKAMRGGKKCEPTFESLGYSPSDLMTHLERQFLKGMSWENMGEWHIDHIIPVSSFRFTGRDDPELKRAWALPNLRPLWAKDNIKKGARRETLL